LRQVLHCANEEAVIGLIEKTPPGFREEQKNSESDKPKKRQGE